ncbi:MAG TPA: hypothetical protein VEL76_33205 [Gemmataceae bacterium]|nr:hypothetical protein [Gemmataceae bacterium]
MAPDVPNADPYAGLVTVAISLPPRVLDGATSAGQGLLALRADAA